MIGGSVSGENGKYFVHCSAPTKEASIRIFHRSKLVVEKKIMVVKVSEPIAYVVGDTSVTEGLISKKHFLTFNSLIVKINVPYMGMNIIRFEVKKKSNNLVADSLENVGYAFSSNLKKMLGSAMKGDVIIFKNIVSTGPDDSGIIHKEIKLTVAD